MTALERSRRLASIDESLGVCTMPVVEKSVKIRPRGMCCLTCFVTSHIYTGGSKQNGVLPWGDFDMRIQREATIMSGAADELLKPAEG